MIHLAQDIFGSRFQQMRAHVRMLRNVDYNFKIYQLEDLGQLLLVGKAET